MGVRYPEINYFSSLYEEINKIFREILRSDPASERALETMTIPAVDIYETREEIIVDVEAPGLDPASLKVSFRGGRLHIEGFKPEHVEEGRQNYICMERSFGRFHRIIPLNRAVDLKRTEGVFHQGILTVRFPKMPEKRGEPIDIPVRVVGESEGRDG